MSVIKELESTLRGAKRALNQAQRNHLAAADEATTRRKEVQRCEARVNELEAALSLLRNGLRTAKTETSGGNVTQLKPRDPQ